MSDVRAIFAPLPPGTVPGDNQRTGSHVTQDQDAPLSDQAFTEYIHRLARTSVTDINIALARLLLDGVDQIQDEVGTFRHEESSTYLFDRAQEALDVQYAEPQHVVAALARMSAALIVRFSETSGRDPKKIMQVYLEYLEAHSPRG